jgi:hypothetical protein
MYYVSTEYAYYYGQETAGSLTFSANSYVTEKEMVACLEYRCRGFLTTSHFCSPPVSSPRRAKTPIVY